MTLTTSAKQHFGLTNILSCCQKAVLSPVQVLLDSNTNTLKPEFEKACLRIFRLCDHDQDQFLNDDELVAFQESCFQKKLQINHITALKEVLLQEGSSELYDEDAALKGINFHAFLTMQKILLRKLQSDICWAMLRHYGYTRQLTLQSALTQDQSVGKLHLARGFELSKSAAEFLVGLYRQETAQS
jgi:Ras family protein T1